MKDNRVIVEKLSQFNNLSFTKKQWEIILKGCGCPSSSHFWKSLRDNNLTKVQNKYSLSDVTIDSFAHVWNTYCMSNRSAVKKAYNKAKTLKKIEEQRKHPRKITFYEVNGYLTTEKPNYD